MDKPLHIKTPITAELDAFKTCFDAALTSQNPLLHDVILHLTRKSGKMMRPILVLLTAKLFGKVTPATLHAAVSLELLHTASLVHDDVVDDSAERRGQPSVNSLFSNKVAVLAGDYLLATSLVEVTKTAHLSIIELVSVLGQDLADGELLQLSNLNNRFFSEQIYYEVIRKKTAVLFAACAKAGALSCGTNDENVEKARLFGEYLGICFQIKDDIFDYSPGEDIGKPTGNDMHEGKLTLPVIYVLNNVDNEEMHRIALKVRDKEASADEIARLVQFTQQHGGIEYAEQAMKQYREKALGLLDDTEDGEVKQALITYLDYVIERKK